MFCTDNTTTVPKESCNQLTNTRLNQPIYESMYQWIDRWVVLWIGVMTVCRCLVMGADPPATLQGLPTTCAQWQPTGWFSVVYARTYGNTVRVRAGSSPKTALPHAEITDPDTVPIAFRTRCVGCCALHTPRQHHQAKLAPQHSTKPLLKKALDGSTSSAAPSSKDANLHTW